MDGDDTDFKQTHEKYTQSYSVCTDSEGKHEETIRYAGMGGQKNANKGNCIKKSTTNKHLDCYAFRTNQANFLHLTRCLKHFSRQMFFTEAQEQKGEAISHNVTE